MALSATLSVISSGSSATLAEKRFSNRLLNQSRLFAAQSVEHANRCCPRRSPRPFNKSKLIVALATPKAASSYQPSSFPSVQQFDFLVLGSGIAGLTYALKVAEHGRVAIVTKGEISEGATRYAQGGICAVLDTSDSVEAHVRDTMIAGAFLNDPRAVDVVCREGPQYVLELADFGARFTRTDGGDLHLTREGGHSARRIVHAADATGAEIERALVTAATAHPNITFFENHLAVDLVLGEGPNGGPLALGADVLCPDKTSMSRFVAPVTMLATGGAGQVYPLTTNPAVATGDGMAMAHRAKAAVANLEFVQFHPTALYAPGCPNYPATAASASSSTGGIDSNAGPAFLISEAVRGEGGRLFNLDGDRFMLDYDDRAELAPRDVVARAIHSEMSASGSQHVMLDISHKPASKILSHFPNIAAHCAELGVDITQDAIPVKPAQHYMCGGVQSGLHGETTIPGLFACGEVACSGLHGANRLASNSLLEGLVFGSRAVGKSTQHAQRIAATAPGALRAAIESADFTGPRAPRALSQAASAWVAAKRSELTKLMWSSAGIVRHQAKIQAALQDVAEIYLEIRALCEHYGVNSEVVELRNLVIVGELILSSALQRRESRGGHFCEDYPEPVPTAARATVINTSMKRRLDLGKIKAAKQAGGQQTFGGAVPGSPRRKAAGKRELSISPRSVEE
jgi:L-aspartate oxidase